MIREIQTEDAPAIAAIICESLGYETDGETVGAQIATIASDGHYLSLVWVDDEGTVVGFIHAVEYQTLHRDGGWDVISLAVARARQGEGIGSELLRGFEERIVQRGASYVRLNSRVERSLAHAFYERRGYTSDKLQKRFIKTL